MALVPWGGAWLWVPRSGVVTGVFPAAAVFLALRDGWAEWVGSRDLWGLGLGLCVPLLAAALVPCPAQTPAVPVIPHMEKLWVGFWVSVLLPEAQIPQGDREPPSL